MVCNRCCSRCGLQCELPEDYKEIGIFDLFLTQDFYAGIVEETYRYAAQHKQKLADATATKGKTYASRWKDVSEVDTEVFLALTLPTIKNYWSTKPLLQGPAFSLAMSRDRSMSIMAYLHFADN